MNIAVNLFLTSLTTIAIITVVFFLIHLLINKKGEHNER